jgi:hypothetical protein
MTILESDANRDNGGGREWGGPRQRWRRARGVDLAAVGEAVDEASAWTRRRLGRRSMWCRGGRGGGTGTRRGPDGGRRGIDVDAEEEWARGVDLTAVGEERPRDWRGNDSSQGYALGASHT